MLNRYGLMAFHITFQRGVNGLAKAYPSPAIILHKKTEKKDGLKPSYYHKNDSLSRRTTVITETNYVLGLNSCLDPAMGLNLDPCPSHLQNIYFCVKYVLWAFQDRYAGPGHFDIQNRNISLHKTNNPKIKAQSQLNAGRVMSSTAFQRGVNKRLLET